MATLVAGMITAAHLQADDYDNGDVKLDRDMALTNPDEFNWTVLIGISKKAPATLQFDVGSNHSHTNNAVWETWADDPFTFTQRPHGAAPDWADRNKGMNLGPIRQQIIRAEGMERASSPHIEAILPTGGGEVVMRSKSSFDFIMTHQLYYREGIAAAFKAAVNAAGYPSGKRLDFDPGAIEIKAVYQPLDDKLTKDNCHWNYASDGKAYGLVALHVMTKQLPNWTWATWEWSGNTPTAPNGNPGRSDWYGSRDSFGATYLNATGQPTHFQPPGTLGQQYPSGTVTPELLALFKAGGFSDEWQKEWMNYRLKGSQIEFADITGVTTLLGNSVTEQGFVQTSSCITCHANAAADATGRMNPSGGFVLDRQSTNGPLNPAWFVDVDSAPRAHNQEFGNFKLRYYPMDFIWALSLAQPKVP